MAISLVASSRGVALLPASIQDTLPQSIVSRPLGGVQPTIDLMVGYRRDNDSPILSMFLNKLSELLVQHGENRAASDRLRQCPHT